MKQLKVSPELNTQIEIAMFLSKLKEKAGGWRTLTLCLNYSSTLHTIQYLRQDSPFEGISNCPLSAVYGGDPLSSVSRAREGKLEGLSPRVSTNIWHASDCITGYDTSLRRQLLQAVGLA